MLKLRIPLFFTVLAMTLITACTTPEQRYAQERQKQAQLQAAMAQRQASLEARCRGYGFELRTTAFAQCLMKLDQAEQQAESQKKQRAELESRCEFAKAQGWLAPTTTGSFGEGAQRAAAAYNACMAGLPPPTSTRVICQRQGPNDVYCFSQ
jgi:hypothetical protein